MADPGSVREQMVAERTAPLPGSPQVVGRRVLSGVAARLDRWDRLVLAVLSVSVGAWTWLAAGGGLHLDDIRAQAYAAGESFGTFVISSNRTHFSPGARAVDWLHGRFAPFEYWPAVVLIVTVALALGIVSWVILRHLLPRGPAVVAGVAWSVLSPGLIPGLAWYRQALTVGVPVVLMLLAVLSAVAAARKGLLRYALLSVLAQAAALMFSERALLLPPVILVAVLALGATDETAPRWHVLRRPAALVPVLGTGIANVLFLLAYRSGDFDDGSGASPSLAGFLWSTGRSLLRDTIPTLLGGPVRWKQVLFGYSFADPPVLFAVVSSTVVLAAVVAAASRPGPGRSLTRRMLLVVGSYVFPLYVLIYLGRISRDRVESVDDLRLYLDVLVALALASAVGLSALLGRDRQGNPGVRRSPRLRWLVSLGTAVPVALAVVSWVGWGSAWHAETTRGWFATATAEVRAASGSIVPTPFPDSVLPAYYQTDMSTANFVRLVNPAIETTRASVDPQLLDWSGHVVPATFRTVARADPPDNFCGFRLAPGVRSLTIDLPQPVPYQRAELVLLRVLAPDTAVLQVSVVDDHGASHEVLGNEAPTLYRGPHALVYQVPWQVRVTAITVTPQHGHGGLCVTEAPIVLAVPR